MQKYTDEVLINTLKDMLGKAMSFGMSVSEKSVSGSLFDDRHKSIVSDIVSLEQSTREFLSVSGIQNVDSKDIVPLCQEIVAQLPTRRN